MQALFYITTKEAGFDKIRFWHPQRKVRALRTKDRKNGIPVRHFYLKSRQVGISTDSAAEMATETYGRDNYQATIIAHDKERASAHLQMCHYFYDFLPAEIKLRLGRSTTSRIEFADTRSGIGILTASNFEAQRGGTRQGVLATEFCLYDNPLPVIAGAEMVVPLLAGTTIIIETTAMGAGTPAHDFWLRSLAGETGYRAEFLAWHEDILNQLPPFRSEMEQWEMMEQIRFDYPDLIEKGKKFNLLPRQLGWYYITVKRKCHGDFDYACQEYPMDEAEAWISSGTPYFPRTEIDRYFTKTRDGVLYSPIKGGEVCTFRSLEELTVVTNLKREEHAYLEVWQKPVKGRKYVIGADGSLGFVGSDFSSAYVIDMHTLEMCAEYHGRPEPHEFARLLASLGYAYNNAIVAPEVDNPGCAILSHLQQIYFNIYQWRQMDSYGLKITNRLGWSTTPSSRPMMLDNAKKLFHEFYLDADLQGMFVRSRMLLNEMRTFSIQDAATGKPAAERNCHDDRVIAFCITHMVIAQETYGSNPASLGALHVPKAVKEDYRPEGKTIDDIVDELMNGTRGWSGLSPYQPPADEPRW